MNFCLPLVIRTPKIFGMNFMNTLGRDLFNENEMNKKVILYIQIVTQ